MCADHGFEREKMGIYRREKMAHMDVVDAGLLIRLGVSGMMIVVGAMVW